MTEQLDRIGKIALESWINKGSKDFQLLYSFKQDGCDASVFHRKCDNQGPTVTVVYNTQGSVYGGYTNTSWSSNGQYGTDADAFLFSLAFSGNVAMRKFTMKPGGHSHAIYCRSHYGPTFGSGHDIRTFTGTISPQNCVYTLNGCTGFNSAYDFQGIPSTQVMNDIQTVKNLEVYGVVDGKAQVEGGAADAVPWRNSVEWNNELFETLLEEVETFSPPSDMPIKQSNILVIGPVGAGKSSFINTIATVLRGQISRLAVSGSAEDSITSKYRMFALRNPKRGGTLNFRLCDTRGLEESNGIDALEMNYLLAGNVPNGYQFNPSIPISPDTPGFKKNPGPGDYIHCVCLTVDGSTVDVISERMLERIKSLQKVTNLKGVPLLVIVTKIDKICSSLENDLQSAFKNATIKDLVDKVSQMFGVSRNNVLPAKNYEREMDTNDDVSTLALLNLKQMLMASEDFMYTIMDEYLSSEMCTDSESSKE